MQPFVNVLSAYAPSLREEGSRLFSSPLHWLMLGNGDADFHDNIIFFGFEGWQADPVLVVKLPRLPENGWMLQTEYDRLTELWDCLGEEADLYLPKPYAMETLQGRPALLLSYVPGDSLTRLSRTPFWRNRKQVLALGIEAARSLRRLNDCTASPLQPGEVLDGGFPDVIDTFRQLFRPDPEEDGALSSLTEVVEDLRASASRKVLIQGDFWHGNMIRQGRRGRLKFLDWQFARWSVDVSMDVYFFLLAGAMSANGDGPVEQRARRTFRLLNDWRVEVIPGYLEAYGRPTGYVLLPVKYGMMLCCVEKAVRSALDFGYSHKDDLTWRYLFAQLLHWPHEDQSPIGG